MELPRLPGEDLRYYDERQIVEKHVASQFEHTMRAHNEEWVVIS